MLLISLYIILHISYIIIILLTVRLHASQDLSSLCFVEEEEGEED